MKTNIAVPAIIGGRQNVYFFPYIVLVAEGNRTGAVPYKQLRLSWKTEKFIEKESVTNDSQIIGYTLSKSGIGLSVGVKGLRVGSGPRGNYVHMNRYGLYWLRAAPITTAIATERK